ncbi:MAG: phosphoribosylaminoimidazolesuccinocarboxamide synthase [Candidatus Glassbacteria bacterium]|nr:phosphoribosylaminoimidazolesuccinocarboxamide synthase [Candidatus Glassbacteria bacterium]
MQAIRETNLNIGELRRGKVRDCYDLEDHLLLVATDRISAFDVVMPNGIPYKGRVLNSLSAFWFGKTGHLADNHVLTTDVGRIVEMYPGLAGREEVLDGRTTLGRKAQPVPVECVVRGFLAGSAWVEYTQKGTVAEARMLSGLERNQKFETPLFTPAIKAQSGHDENISIEKMKQMIGDKLAGRIIETSLSLYNYACKEALQRGILIADTKFEFGLAGEELLVIDEMFTPDSSRFWLADNYRPGAHQEGFDKQPLRDWLQKLTDQGKWDKTPPAPDLPPEIVSFMSDLYRRAYRMITGEEIT